MVGPGGPTGNRLGPERLAILFGSTLLSKTSPMKQLLISSQFCKPHTTSFLGSGFHGLFGELSKCEMPIRRVPLGSKTGSANSKPSCQLKSHLALSSVCISPVG